MAIYHGVVQDGVVRLSEGVHLADGLHVEVRTPATTPERADAVSSEALFKERLREAGLVRETKTPPLVQPEGDRTPIVVSGKPLSQTIIEERR